MKTKLVKIILLLLLGSLFIASLISVIINVIGFSQKSLSHEVVYKVIYHSFSRRHSTGGNWTYYVLEDSKSLSGQYNDREDFNIKSGDTISYRRIDFSDGIRAIKLNGKEIQSRYGFWDIFSLCYILIIASGFYYYPKLINSLKEKHNYKLISDYHKER